jgi:hypothetical protein
MEDSLVQKTPILNESGQSAIEFILTFMFAFGITFLFINHTLNITSGYFAHYVNFMAARTYLTVESGSDAFEQNNAHAKRLAKEVVNRFPLKKFGIDPKLEVISFDDGSALFSGTTLYFEQKVSLMPIIGGKDKGRFLSESFLGKEPTISNCLQMVCQAMTGSRDSCKGISQKSMTLYDNGC